MKNPFLLSVQQKKQNRPSLSGSVTMITTIQSQQVMTEPGVAFCRYFRLKLSLLTTCKSAVLFFDTVYELSYLFKPTYYAADSGDSGITKVGVTRCGNWWCRPIFSLRKKTGDLFSYHLVTTLSGFQRCWSSVLCNLAAKIISVVSPPGWYYPRRSAPPPPVTLLAADSFSKFNWNHLNHFCFDS